MLAGKNCVVTAGSGGIGKGIVRALLQNGAFVFFSGRSAGTVNPVVEEFKNEGLTSVHGIIADVSNRMLGTIGHTVETAAGPPTTSTHASKRALVSYRETPKG